MDDFFKSLGESIKKRAASAFLGTYTVFWGLFHWQGIYTTLFVDEKAIIDKFGLLKNEYVDKYFFGYEGWNDWLFYLGFLLPLLLTFCFIWFLPKYVLIPAFKKEREYKFNKQKIIIDHEIQIEKHRASLASASEKTLAAEEKVIQKEKAIVELDPTKAWEVEYERFNKSGLINILSQLVDSIYKHSGHIKRYYDEQRETWVSFGVDSDSIALAHSNGLVNISEDGQRISLTEKGRYFVQQNYYDRLP